MGRKYDFLAGTKVPTTGGTTTFTSSDVPSKGIVAYYFAWDDTGDGTTISDLTRIRVKSSGVSIIDCSGLYLRALMQRFGWARPAYSDRGLDEVVASAGLATAKKRFSIPLFNLTDPNAATRDAVQFPPDSNVTIELTWGTVGTNPVIQVGWAETDMAPRAFPKVLASQMNIPASQASGRYSFSEEGVIAALGLNLPGNARTRFVLSGEQILHMGGQLANSATDLDSLLWECQQLDSRWPDLANGTAVTNAVGATCADPLWLELGMKRPAAQGSSFVELQTTAAWAGAANELGVYAFVPLAQAQAA